jgi:hypothetical protein
MFAESVAEDTPHTVGDIGSSLVLGEDIGVTIFG